MFVFSNAGVIGTNSILISGLLADKNSVVVLCKSVSITVIFWGGKFVANALANMIVKVLLPTPPLTFAMNIDFALSLFEKTDKIYTFFKEKIKLIAFSYISFSLCILVNFLSKLSFLVSNFFFKASNS